MIIFHVIFRVIYDVGTSLNLLLHAGLQSNNTPFGAEEMLYDGSSLTTQQAILLILSYSLRHSLSHAAIDDLLQLLRTLLPANAQAACISSYYKFEQSLPTAQERSKCVYFCPNEECRAIVQYGDSGNDSDTKYCSSCSKQYYTKQLKLSGNFFLFMSLQTQISLILNTYGHLLHSTKADAGEGTVADIHDGAIYKDIEGLRHRKNISLTWNVDGVPLFKSSANELWPIRCIINELPHDIATHNVILAAIYFGKLKPNMTAYMAAFVEQINDVNKEGVKWSHPKTSEAMGSLVYPLISTCDAVARCMVQCLHQFNGAYGCTWCVQKGRRVVKGAGHVNVYPLVDSELRTHEELLVCARNVTANETSEHVMGVKSASPLFLLRKYGFDMVRGFAVDYMHCVLLGLQRQFIDIWTDSKYHEAEWYLPASKVADIDRMLLCIKPPCDIKRFPRSVKLAGKWKASELRSFLLFYSMFVLQNALPDKYLKHWSLLVHSMHALLHEKISRTDLVAIDSMLREFVSKTEALYGVEHMSFNLHQLCHMVECVQYCGPIWRVSAFSFESDNQQILKLFSGNTFIPHQIEVNQLRLICVRELSNTALKQASSAANTAVEQCVQTWLNGYPVTKSAVYVCDTTIALGSFTERQLIDHEQQLLRVLDPLVSSCCNFYNRALIRGKPYCTDTYGRDLKTHSFSVFLKNHCFAQLNSFVVDPVRKKMYILCKLYSKNCRSLLKMFSVSHFYGVSLTNTIIAIQPNDIIGKVIYLSSVRHGAILAVQPNLMECD